MSACDNCNCDFMRSPRAVKRAFYLNFIFCVHCSKRAGLPALARSASWKLHNVLASRALELRESLELLESHEFNARVRAWERERERENIARDLFDADKFRSIHTRPRCVNSIADLWLQLASATRKLLWIFSNNGITRSSAFLRIHWAACER